MATKVGSWGRRAMEASQHPVAPFTSADVGAMVTIKGDDAIVDGVPRFVLWGGAKRHDCSGRIQSVEERRGGVVQLEDGQVFDNGQAEAKAEVKLGLGKRFVLRGKLSRATTKAASEVPNMSIIKVLEQMSVLGDDDLSCHGGSKRKCQVDTVFEVLNAAKDQPHKASSSSPSPPCSSSPQPPSSSSSPWTAALSARPLPLAAAAKSPAPEQAKSLRKKERGAPGKVRSMSSLFQSRRSTVHPLNNAI